MEDDMKLSGPGHRAALFLASVSLAACVFATPAQALASQAWTPPGATACQFDGWTNSLKPAIPVRDGPSSDAARVGMLPVTADEEESEYTYSVRFRVTEALNGWLKIDQASDDYNEAEGAPPREVYRGSGWIRSDDARVGIQSGRGYAQPDSKSERLLDLGGDWLTDRGQIQNIVACSGEWLLLDYQLNTRATSDGRLQDIPEKDRGIARAWFRGVCSNEETTCDMRSVDKD